MLVAPSQGKNRTCGGEDHRTHVSDSEDRLCPFHWPLSPGLLLGNYISSDEVLILILNNCIFLNVKSRFYDYHLSFVGKQYRREKNVLKSSIGISKF